MRQSGWVNQQRIAIVGFAFSAILLVAFALNRYHVHLEQNMNNTIQVPPLPAEPERPNFLDNLRSQLLCNISEIYTVQTDVGPLAFWTDGQAGSQRTPVDLYLDTLGSAVDVRGIEIQVFCESIGGRRSMYACKIDELKPVIENHNRRIYYLSNLFMSGYSDKFAPLNTGFHSIRVEIKVRHSLHVCTCTFVVSPPGKY
jgi:hypothetical protein